jgi:3-methyladenine DNA glycosylase AlkD
MKCEEIIEMLRQGADPECVAGMARFGINPDKTLGLSIPFLWNISKEIGKDHELAGQLWRSGIREARILAGIIDEPEKVTEKQMDRWVRDFDSWDVCDQVCSRLFDKTPFAYKKASEWTKRDEEYAKRAGFAMMAVLSVHDKKASDKEFEKFLPMIVRAAKDERNYVRKAVNWALRQIGKRNRALNKKAIQTAEKIRRIDSKSARWIAADALRELKSDAVQRRLK